MKRRVIVKKESIQPKEAKKKELNHETRVVRIRRKNGEVVQDCDVYIGRRMTMGGWNLPQSKWANPYKLSDYSPEECLRKYRKHIFKSGLISEIEELRGKVLGCWCKPGPCHGDVLIELLEESG